FFSSRRRHTRSDRDWSSDVCSSDLAVKKVTYELVTLARTLGEPAVVWTGPGADGAQARLAEYGAAKVYAADSADYDDYVVAPKRSEERRVGKECRARGGPEASKRKR